MCDITPFTELPVTTMTIMTCLTNKINPVHLFHYLPITWGTPINKKGKGSLRFEPEAPGSIFGICLPTATGFIVRGRYPINNSKAFKHSVSLIMQGCTPASQFKQHSVKLSPTCIQITGAKCAEDGVEDAEQLSYYIQTLHDIKCSMKDPHNQELKTKYEATMQWALEISKGPECINEITKKIDYKVNTDKVSEWPDYVDTVLADLFMGYRRDHPYYSDYENKLDTLLHMDFDFMEGDAICAGDSKVVMANYNYNLGISIERKNLRDHIRNYGFLSHYTNQINNYVIIRLPYEQDPKINYICKKKKSKKHTFTVYKSGSVTQSGPGGSQGEEAYYKFRNAVLELKEQITLEYTKPAKKKLAINV